MPEYNIAFARLEQLLPFLHTLATALFVGLGAAIWLFAKYFLRGRDDEQERQTIFLLILRKFGLLAILMVAIIAVTGALMHLDSGHIKSADPMANAILMTKWTLNAFIVLNLAYMSYHYKKAWNSLREHEFIELTERLIVIVYYFVPLNLAVSAIAIYLGVAYRGF